MATGKEMEHGARSAHGGSPPRRAPSCSPGWSSRIGRCSRTPARGSSARRRTWRLRGRGTRPTPDSRQSSAAQDVDVREPVHVAAVPDRTGERRVERDRAERAERAGQGPGQHSLSGLVTVEDHVDVVVRDVERGDILPATRPRACTSRRRAPSSFVRCERVPAHAGRGQVPEVHRGPVACSQAFGKPFSPHDGSP